jgi:two-component system OmpR family response regulator
VRVLAVEDEAVLSAQLAHAPGDAGYVSTARATASAPTPRADRDHDAVVLDLGLPKIDGLTILRRWRDAGVMVPSSCSRARQLAREGAGIDAAPTTTSPSRSG